MRQQASWRAACVVSSLVCGIASLAHTQDALNASKTNKVQGDVSEVPVSHAGDAGTIASPDDLAALAVRHLTTPGFADSFVNLDAINPAGRTGALSIQIAGATSLPGDRTGSLPGELADIRTSKMTGTGQLQTEAAPPSAVSALTSSPSDNSIQAEAFAQPRVAN